ncbi:hypothetical protein QE408_002139 [Agrobacterium larrymoorei]|uniref:Uncharacterized protein n=1 Tax=Agrobacterium larrymoorei TaxID=160699 RepID=A0ABU0UJ81_9HYPH|nr:hypothetical protein [Agrobacterium larrymoorei]
MCHPCRADTIGRLSVDRCIRFMEQEAVSDPRESSAHWFRRRLARIVTSVVLS